MSFGIDRSVEHDPEIVGTGFRKRSCSYVRHDFGKRMSLSSTGNRQPLFRKVLVSMRGLASILLERQADVVLRDRGLRRARACDVVELGLLHAALERRVRLEAVQQRGH